MSHLFEPPALRGITLTNRIAVSPMCRILTLQVKLYTDIRIAAFYGV